VTAWGVGDSAEITRERRRTALSVKLSDGFREGQLPLNLELAADTHRAAEFNLLYCLYRQKGLIAEDFQKNLAAV